MKEKEKKNFYGNLIGFVFVVKRQKGKKKNCGNQKKKGGKESLYKSEKDNNLDFKKKKNKNKH